MTQQQQQPAPHAEQRAGIIAGATAYVVWGLLTIYWKQLRDFDAFELIGWRITASAVIMAVAVSYTHLRAHETPEHLVCRLLLEKKKATCSMSHD